MIADDRDHPIEWAVKLVTMPIWGPVFLVGVGATKVWNAMSGRKPKPEPKVIVPQPVWTPVSDLERTVYAAMILAGRPSPMPSLLAFMNVSAGEASRRVKALEGVLHKEQHRARGQDQPPALALTRGPAREIERGFSIYVSGALRRPGGQLAEASQIPLQPPHSMPMYVAADWTSSND